MAIKNYAIVLNGNVESTYQYDSNDLPVLPGFLVIEIPEGIPVAARWGWDGTNFVEPPAIDPNFVPDVTKEQIRRALIDNYGFNEESVDEVFRLAAGYAA
jgi:hypothetical protein